jgi:hypothetical protein
MGDLKIRAKCPSKDWGFNGVKVTIFKPFTLLHQQKVGLLSRKLFSLMSYTMLLLMLTIKQFTLVENLELDIQTRLYRDYRRNRRG